jgi:hypothetical protein
MKMTTRLTLALILLGVTGTAFAGLDLEVGPWNAAPLLGAITSARKVESFLLSAGGMVPDSIPNIGQYRIAGAGPQADSAEVATLLNAVRVASSDTCGLPVRGLFDPRYAFRFHDAIPPLDLLISLDCQAWHFQRGMQSVPGCRPWCGCVGDSLKKLVGAVFADSVVSR